MASRVPQVKQVRNAFHEELHPTQQSALISWIAFTTTFIGVRILTHSIRKGEGPFRNVTAGGVHLHHYLWGILMVTGAGGAALRGGSRLRRHPIVAIAYGAGLGLIVDEFALLLDLRDVYWAKQGRWSVDLAVTTIASAGSALVGLPVMRRLARDRQDRERPESA